MLKTTYLHEGWEFSKMGWPGAKIATVETGWLPATVPGHVHLDLVENGVIGHPFERMNELGCQWVDEQDWSYRIRFEWEPDSDLPFRTLKFGGLDTICEVFLNDQSIAKSENMFVPLEVDVTELLVPGENLVQVDFRSASQVGRARRSEYLSANNLPEDLANFDERSFVRKAQYMFGWDWGPRLVSCGIWRPVELLEFAARITDVQVVQKYKIDGSVDLDCTIEFQGEANGWFITGATPQGSYFQKPVEQVRTQTISISEPDLWSPSNPNLYKLGFSLVKDTGGDDSEIFDSEIQDFRVCQVGLVRTELSREKDIHGESFEFVVNGKREWIRGANWIPDHSFPSVVDRSRYRDRLEKAVDMGFNMIRVWGGGLYETDEFYEICDELGLLVWQDFPFACAYYPENPEFQDLVRVEAEKNIKRLRNHPSLAIWCGNNENLEMFLSKWGGPSRNPDHCFGEPIYDELLPTLVSSLNPGTPYIPSSPIGEVSNHDANQAHPGGANAGGTGDQHCWDVWHGRGDWRYYSDSTARFSSEYGFVSSCNLALWEKTLQDEDWSPHSKAVQWHDRTGKGHETFHNLVRLHYPDSKTLEDWVYFSQLNQRDALRFGIEHYRRSEFCRGSLIWQLNDCWPVQSWAILDSHGDYKALAYDLRRTYSDRLLSIVREQDRVAVWAVNDTEETWSSSISLVASHLQTGNALVAWEADFDLEPGGRRSVLEASIAGLPGPDIIIFASDLIGQEETWQLVAEPKNVRLPAPEPLVISTHADGFLTIKTTTPLVDLMLTEAGSTAPFIENFITVSAPGVFDVAIKRVPGSLEARSLAGTHSVRFTRSPL